MDLYAVYTNKHYYATSGFFKTENILKVRKADISEIKKPDRKTIENFGYKIYYDRNHLTFIDVSFSINKDYIYSCVIEAITPLLRDIKIKKLGI